MKSNEEFLLKHIGPSSEEQKAMLDLLGIESIEDLIGQTIPTSILDKNHWESEKD